MGKEYTWTDGALRGDLYAQDDSSQADNRCDSAGKPFRSTSGGCGASLATKVHTAFRSGLHQAALDQLSIRPIQSIFSDGLGFHPAHETPDAFLQENLG